MDYEKKIREYLNNDEVDQLYKSMLVNLFPELAESEDEKIRKEIVEVFKSLGDGKIPVIINFADIFSWLEKQGEHYNFRKKIQVGDQVTRNEDGVLVNLSQLKRVAKPADAGESEKQGEKKPVDNVEQKGMNLDEENMTPFQKKVFCIIDTTIEEEQGLKQVCDELLRLAHDEIMQKPEWSEEDEMHRNAILECLWDDELDDGICEYEHVKWLKSIRPQSHWKPSKEQLDTLTSVTWDEEFISREKVLKELLEQLKAL